MLTHDIRYAVRVLRKSPGFTTVAVLTLALGVGANTAVFSVVDAVLLQPLPYAQPERLVSLWEVLQSRTTGGITPATFADYQTAQSFEAIAAYDRTSMSLTKTGPPEQVLAEAVTWNLFSALGWSPEIGRVFRPEEDRKGSDRVVVLTHSLWRTRFGSDPAILGRAITLNGEPHVVIGVMPADFLPLSQSGSGFRINFFVPAAYDGQPLATLRERTVSVVGRLKPGVSLEQAQAELRTISDDLSRRFPETNRDVTARIAPFRDVLVDRVRVSLVVMLGAVALVLLIASVNLANLMLVRAVGQRHEVAIRMAVGATRGQIALDLAVRGVILGALGGAAGLACGLWTRDVLVSMAPVTMPRIEHLALNMRVVAVTSGLSLIAGMLAGLLPALQIWRGGLAPTLRGTAVTTSAAQSVARWRGLLMASEVAAALMLAVAAGLLIRSHLRLTNVDLGFQTDGVLTFTVLPPEPRYRDPGLRTLFFEEIERRIAAIAGVRSVATADEFPMRGGSRTAVLIKGEGARVGFDVVSPGYFTTLGVPLLRGRSLSENDRAGTPAVAVVSQTFVNRFLRGRDPIGQRFRCGTATVDTTIVGVAADARRDGKQAAITPQVYVPAGQIDVYSERLSAVAVRTSGDPYAFVPSIQRAIWSIDPDQPITNVQTLDDVVWRGMAGRRFNMTLLTVLTILAFALALVGVYGVVAQAAAQRTREMGIRMALGARRGHVIALIVVSGLKWALAGVAAGMVGAYLLTTFMRGLLFEIQPTDATTFGTAAAIAIAVAFIASYVPAERVASGDPLSALRAE